MALSWVGAQQGLGTVSGLMKWTWNAYRGVGGGGTRPLTPLWLPSVYRGRALLGRRTSATLTERAQSRSGLGGGGGALP